MPEQEIISKQKLNIWLPLLFSLVLVIGMILGARLNEAMNPQPKSDKVAAIPIKQPGTVEELIRFIEARYVDDVNVKKISEAAINKILDELDPHSAFIPAEKVATVREQLDGSFVGVGIEFIVLEDTITVVKPSIGGPAEKAGLLAGDQIISVDDSLVAGMSYLTNDFMSLFRGEQGSMTQVKVKREGVSELLSFDIVRDQIQMPSLDVAYEIQPKVGFIKLSRFSSETSAEFIQALETLVEEKEVEKLIVDLRDNPGGYLQEAVEILSQLFSEKDKLLVYTEGEKSNRLDYKTTGRPFYQIKDIAVLVNENSASASEIIAGAIQDWDRGYIIGRRSFGKGLVQEQYNLSDGSVLRLTVARYYTPSGRSIQKDYQYGEDDYNAEFSDRLNSGELFFPDSIKVVDSMAYETPSGRLVYGGGGITPDYFIPLDSLILNDNFLMVQPYVQEYVYRYFRKNKAEFDFETAKDLIKNYKVEDYIIDDFLSYVKEKGANKLIEFDEDTRKYLKTSFKSQFANLQFDEEARFATLNREDPYVIKALQLLKDEIPIAKNQTAQ